MSDMAAPFALPQGFDWRAPDYSLVYAERIKRLERIRSGEVDLDALKAYYADDRPGEFIHDWGMTFDPRNSQRKLPTTMPFLLFPKQQEFEAWLTARWRNSEDGLGEKSRDMGVSWLCIGWAVWAWLFHEGMVVGFGSRKEEYVDDLNDPKSLFWKARNFIGLLPAEFQPAGWNPRKHAPFMSIVNPENGSAIVGEAGDNIGRGNRTSIYFKDESAFYERPESIDAALSQTTNCAIDISTPNGEGNPFARKRRSGRLPVFRFHWTDDPRKDQTWYDEQVRKLDAVVVAQEIDISYSASVSNAWIPAAHVIQAMNVGPAGVPRTGPWRLGVDVARFGDDKTVLTMRGHRAAFVTLAMGKVSTEVTAARVRDTVVESAMAGIKIEQIAVDGIGIGAGVVDKLLVMDELKHVQIVEVNSSIRLDDGLNYNMRAFMWRAMRDWLNPNNGIVGIKRNPELEVDLTALRYEYRNGLLLMEDKAQAKKRGVKSPDYADSLALTFAAPVKPRDYEPEPMAPTQILDPVMGY